MPTYLVASFFLVGMFVGKVVSALLNGKTSVTFSGTSYVIGIIACAVAIVSYYF